MKGQSMITGLAVVLVVYMLVLFGFAGIYYRLFRRNPNNFQFNADISLAQHERLHTELSALIRSLKEHAGILEQFRSGLHRGVAPKTSKGDDTYDLESTRIVVRNVQVAMAPAGISYYLKIVALSNNGDELAAWSWGNWYGGIVSRDRDTLTKVVTELQAMNSERIRVSQQRLSTMSEQVTEVWSYWDFVYFSGISITTVGYGDILPNTTAVRLLVLTEVLLGIVLFVFVLNVVLNHSPK